MNARQRRTARRRRKTMKGRRQIAKGERLAYQKRVMARIRDMGRELCRVRPVPGSNDEVYPGFDILRSQELEPGFWQVEIRMKPAPREISLNVTIGDTEDPCPQS